MIDQEIYVAAVPDGRDHHRRHRRAVSWAIDRQDRQAQPHHLGADGHVATCGRKGLQFTVALVNASDLAPCR